ncbi:MAG: DotU family type IV/VI secretion system protein, partial [Geminicoccaceae bacterium]
DYPTGYEGSPPYGLELLTIFASPTPLFEAKRPAFEKASTYLPALRKRLDELAKGPDRKSIAGSLVFVRTVP